MQFNKIFLITMALVASIASYILYTKFFSTPVTAADTRSQLIVGLNAEYQPFAFRRDGKIVGFDIDLIEEVGKRLGKQVVMEDMPFDALIPAIQLGQVQVAASGMTPTPEREQAVLFTDLYFTGDPLVIMTTAAAPLKTVSELADKNVVVNEGFHADSYITKMSSTIPMNIMRLFTVNDALLALDTGRADAFVTALIPVRPFLAQDDNATKFAITVIPETQDHYAIAVSKEHAHLRGEINTLLEALKQEGFIAALEKKWNLS
jgi:ABC-type amino acid transport substrate-binding protein